MIGSDREDCSCKVKIIGGVQVVEGNSTPLRLALHNGTRTMSTYLTAISGCGSGFGCLIMEPLSFKKEASNETQVMCLGTIHSSLKSVGEG